MWCKRLKICTYVKLYKKNITRTILVLLTVLLLFRVHFYYNFYFGAGWQSQPEKFSDSYHLENPTEDYVLLLHGIRASAGCMDKIAHFLDSKGYIVINLDYPSSKYDIETLVENYIAPVIASYSTDPTRTLHIVTHSMGGLVLRKYLESHDLPNLGNIVMIAPPNHGSEWSDFFASWPIAEFFMGPALSEMKTGENGITEKLPEPKVPTGIIAGRSIWSPIGNYLTDGDTDGKVSVESTKLKYMKEFILVAESHISILSSEEVLLATERFLKTENF